jgi:hypothetical protein
MEICKLDDFLLQLTCVIMLTALKARLNLSHRASDMAGEPSLPQTIACFARSTLTNDDPRGCQETAVTAAEAGVEDEDL